MSQSDLFLHLQYIIVVIAFLPKDILLLRSLFIISCILAILAGAMNLLYPMIFWNSLICLINIFYVSILLLERKQKEIPNHLQNIYEQLFTDFSTNEFMYLYKYAKNLSYDLNDIIIRENEDLNRLLLLTDGNVFIKKNNSLISTAKPYLFLGEMKMLTGIKPSNDVFSCGKTHLLFWLYDDIRKIKRTKRIIYDKLYTTISRDLIKKIKYLNSKISDQPELPPNS